MRFIRAVDVSPSKTIWPHSSVTRSVSWNGRSWSPETKTDGPNEHAPA